MESNLLGVRGMSLYVGIVTYINAPPTQILHSTPRRLGPQSARDVTASFVCRVLPLFWRSRLTSAIQQPKSAYLPADIHDATNGCH